MRRRKFIGNVATGTFAVTQWASSGFSTFGQSSNGLPQAQANEDIFAYIDRHRGKFDRDLYLKILGSANEFKEGDQIVGVAAVDADSRSIARNLLANTLLTEIGTNPPHVDELFAYDQAID